MLHMPENVHVDVLCFGVFGERVSMQGIDHKWCFSSGIRTVSLLGLSTAVTPKNCASKAQVVLNARDVVGVHRCRHSTAWASRSGPAL